MPRYDFKCRECGQVRPDVWMSSFRDALPGTIDISPCLGCGAADWEKLIPGPNFQVKGYNADNGYSKA